jgi:hypothetical protein
MIKERERKNQTKARLKPRGLGLYLVASWQISRAHGGMMWAPKDLDHPPLWLCWQQSTWFLYWANSAHFLQLPLAVISCSLNFNFLLYCLFDFTLMALGIASSGTSYRNSATHCLGFQAFLWNQGGSLIDTKILSFWRPAKPASDAMVWYYWKLYLDPPEL